MNRFSRRKFSDWKNLAKHAIGGGDPDALIDVGNVVNDALTMLQTVHPWEFLKPSSVMVNLIVDQDYVELPGDCSRILEITFPESWTNGMSPTTLTEIDRLRDAPVANWSLGYWYALNTGEYAHDVNRETGDALPRLELYPTPGDTGPIRVRYERILLPMVEDDDIPGFPHWIEPAFVHLVRAHIQALEDDLPFTEQSPAYVTFTSMLNDLEARDGMQGGNLGQMRGGVDLNFTRPDIFQPESIPDPS